MISNWFTLQKLAVYLNTSLSGTCFSKAVSHRKNELVLLNCDPGAPSLLIHLFSPFQYLRLIPAAEPARSVRIFPELQNEIIDYVHITPNDRNIIFRFRSSAELTVFFRSQGGNALFMSSSENIQYFKKQRQNSDASSTEIQASQNSIASDPRFNRFWKNSIHEIFGAESDSEVYEMLKKSNGITWNGRFILKPLPGEQFDKERFYDNYAGFIRSWVSTENIEKTVSGYRKKLFKEQIGKQRALSGLLSEDDLRLRSEKARFFADTLNSLRNVQETDGKIIIPEELRKDGLPLTITLNSTLSRQENINSLYRRSRELLKSIDTNRDLRSRLESELDYIQAALDTLAKVNSKNDLDAFKKGYAELIEITDRPGLKDGTGLPYREFISPSGLKVWVGRSASQNEDLTFHYAAKTDLWFHTRHGRGSHVILKRAGRRHIDLKDLEYAAVMAARHSEEKHASTVAVVYTERKYVTKIKGAGPGKVRFQNEKNILVDPTEEI